MGMSSRRKRVLASGCFDPLHYGHLRYLEEAKKLGGSDCELIVVVARDSTIRKAKGRPPIIPEEQRRALVEALKPVDRAILGREQVDVASVLRDLRPDIVAVGYDQDLIEHMVREAIEREGLDTEVIRLGKYGDLSSSSMLEKLCKSMGRHP